MPTESRSLVAKAIANPVFSWMLMFALIFFGSISYFRLGVSKLPDVDFPVISVTLNWEGASPEIMENEVVDPVENAVMGVQGVRNVTSISKQGNASVSVEFDLNRSVDQAFQDIQGKIFQIRGNLPKEMDTPWLSKINPEDNPILWVALNQDGTVPLVDFMSYARDVLKNQFTTIPGVGDIILGGYVDPNLRVWLDQEKLNLYNLTVSDIMSAIEREHLELPAGRFEEKGKEINLRVLGEAQTPQDFAKILLSQRGGTPNFVPLKLGQVAKVEEGLAEIRRKSRFLGRDALGIGVQKQRGANAVEVAQTVKKKVEKLRAVLPKGLSLDVNFDSTTFIEESISELIFTLGISAFMTALVCLIFIKSLSSTINVLMAIPTSIIGSLLAIDFLGFTLNEFTLLALTLAVGVVVDDAIMVLENIMRHFEKLRDRVKASLFGAEEIFFSAMASTLALVAIFLPVAFMKGVIGKYFFQFGVTLSVAILISLLEALTLTPMRSSRFLSQNVGEGHSEGFFPKLEKLYRKGLNWSLNHRVFVTVTSLVIFLLSLGLVNTLKKELIPAQDQAMFMLRLQGPVGTALSQTDLIVRKAEAYMAKRDDVLRYYFSMGGFTGGEVNACSAFITLKAKKDRKKTQDEIMNEVRKDLTQISGSFKVFAQDLSYRGFSSSRGFPVEFVVQGPDWKQLVDLSKLFMEKLQGTKMVSDVDTDYRSGQPELEILPDRDKAFQRGVSVFSINETIQALLGGKVVGRFSKGSHRLDVRVRLKDADQKVSQDLKGIFVRNNRGEVVPLRDVVQLTEKESFQSIYRRNKERSIGISANMAQGISQEDVLKKVQEIGKEILPQGYRVVLTGNAESFRETTWSLMFALIVGLIVSYMILASQFNSFIQPITILLALPFSITGALLALKLTNQSINMYSFIGIILLTGIVKKNSILLIDFTNETQKTENLSVLDALRKACPNRLRAILMTSVATIVGAIPVALALGPGAETRIPMAVAIIGGVIVSTFLSLFVVPCVHSFFSGLESRAFFRRNG